MRQIALMVISLCIGLAALFSAGDADAKRERRPAASATQNYPATDIPSILTEQQPNGTFSIAPQPPPTPRKIWPRAAAVFLGLLAGALFGAICSQRLATLRRYMVWSFVGVLAAWGAEVAIAYHDITGFAVSALVGAVSAWFMLRVNSDERDTSLGSAKFAEEHELEAAGLFVEPTADSGKSTSDNSFHASSALFLGLFDGKRGPRRLWYRGAQHGMVISPTQTGKTSTFVIPNLLTYQGSIFCIDIKGTLARSTAKRRGTGSNEIPGMLQKINLLDPFNYARIPGIKPSRFNPLDMVSADPENATENAMMIAEILVERGKARDPFWENQAWWFAGVLVEFVTLDASENEKTLGRVREIACMAGDELIEVLAAMMQSDRPAVRRGAAAMIGETEKVRGSILSTLRASTHWLDSPAIRESLSQSDFKLDTAKSELTTTYAILPVDRLESQAPWLRLITQMMMMAQARNIEEPPKYRQLLLLDEMATLGKIQSVVNGYGLLSEYGVQIVTVFQDMSQGREIFGQSFETMLANSGVIQYYGSRDDTTSSYMSRMAGVTTLVHWTMTSAIVAPFTFIARFLGHTSELKPQSQTKNITQRPLIYPDQLAKMPGRITLLFVDKLDPILARRLPWYEDPERKHLGVNLHELRASRIPAAAGAARADGDAVSSQQPLWPDHSLPRPA